MFAVGIFMYFKPFSIPDGEKPGILIMGLGVIANALASVLGRKMNMTRTLSPVVVTFISMLIGAVTLLIIALIKDGIPVLEGRNVISLLWLSIINTALAFTLWNFSLRTLTAMESSIINGTMLIQIAILSMIFLDMKLTAGVLLSLVTVALGATLVQIKKTMR